MVRFCCVCASVLVACNLDSALPDPPVTIDSRLASLVPSTGSLEPSFDPDTLDYRLDLSLTDDAIGLTVDAFDPESAILVADQATVDGGTSEVPLALGASTIRINVVASDNSESRTYTIDVGRGRGVVKEAYLKASNPGVGDSLGGDGAIGTFALSVSGEILAIGAPAEDSDGNPANDGKLESGAVYVFRRQNDAWVQEAYLKAPNADPGDRFGTSVAVDGDTLVVGALLEQGNGTSPANNGADGSGAAYVFRRSGAGIWSQEGYLKASNLGLGDRLGTSVAISGSTVVVGATGEDSVSGSNPADDSAVNSGAAYVFVRSAANVWSQQAYLKASNPDGFDLFGVGVSISGDTIAVGAHLESSNASGVNGAETNNSSLNSGAVYVFVRSGTTWSQQAYIKAAANDPDDNFGIAVALSNDTLAIGTRNDDAAPRGPASDPNDDSVANSGAVHIYTRTGSTWSLEAFLKASADHGAEVFGLSVALAGDVLAVGAPAADQSAGAAYLFTRVDNEWSEQARLAASTPGVGDNFGHSVATTEATIAVSAIREDSASAGIDGDENNDVAMDSGAAYVFR
jgi:hypothetical protein